MKHQIKAHRVPHAGRVFVPMPKGAETLSVGFQGADLFVWAMADVKAVEDRKDILIWPDDMEEMLPAGMDLRLIGRAERPAAVIVDRQPYVVHVFEIVKEP